MQGIRPFGAVEVFRIMRASLKSHYRRMSKALFQTLTFKSNNEMFQPLMEAVSWIRSNADSAIRVIPADAGLPIEGVVAPKWRPAVIELDGNINRISYELCVLMSLREQLRSKQVYVPGSERYQNPDHDLPGDFSQNRPAYYENLGLNPDTKVFTAEDQKGANGSASRA